MPGSSGEVSVPGRPHQRPPPPARALEAENSLPLSRHCIVTSDQPHLCSLLALVLRVPDTPVDLTELVVEYRLSRDPADITLAGLCMSPDVSYTIQYKKIDVLFTNNASSQIMADRRYYSLQTTDLPPTGCAP